MARIHTRTNAHREVLENAISASAKSLSIDLIVDPATLGAFADAEHNAVLRIATDTFIDLEHAMTLGHARRKRAPRL